MARAVDSELADTDWALRGRSRGVQAVADQMSAESCAVSRMPGGGTVSVGMPEVGNVVGVADHNRPKSRALSTTRTADPSERGGSRERRRDPARRRAAAEAQALAAPRAPKPRSHGSDGGATERGPAGRRRPHDLSRWVAPGTRHSQVHDFRAPRNPLVLGMLCRMDAVVNIGLGIRRIRGLCREHGVAEPIIDVSEHWVTVTFPRRVAQGDEGTGADGRPSMEGDSRAGKLPCSVPVRNGRAPDGSFLRRVGMLSGPATSRRASKCSLQWDLLEHTTPDKPRSGRQRYRLTAAGRCRLADLEGVKR